MFKETAMNSEFLAIVECDYLTTVKYISDLIGLSCQKLHRCEESDRYLFRSIILQLRYYRLLLKNLFEEVKNSEKIGFLHLTIQEISCELRSGLFLKAEALQSRMRSM